MPDYRLEIVRHRYKARSVVKNKLFSDFLDRNTVHDYRIIFTNKKSFFCDSQVSWIKRKNVQELLTVGLTTYANDERFQAIHFHHSEDWTLQIKYVQPRDAGVYECQVSTHPPTSIFLLLDVVGKRKISS